MKKRMLASAIILMTALPTFAVTIDFSKSTNNTQRETIYPATKFTRNWDAYSRMFQMFINVELDSSFYLEGCGTIDGSPIADALIMGWSTIMGFGFGMEEVTGSSDIRQTTNGSLFMTRPNGGTGVSTYGYHVGLLVPVRHASDTNRSLIYTLVKSNSAFAENSYGKEGLTTAVRYALAHCPDPQAVSGATRKFSYTLRSKTVRVENFSPFTEQSAVSGWGRTKIAGSFYLIPDITITTDSAISVSGKPSEIVPVDIPITITTDVAGQYRISTTTTSVKPFTITAVKPSETINIKTTAATKHNVNITVTASETAKGKAGTVRIEVTII